MDETTPAPGFPMSFPDGVAVFQDDRGEYLLFNEGNRQRRIEIDSIDHPPLVHSVAIEGAADGGRDTNGQICQDAEGNFIWGEDSGQSDDPPIYAGWGVFDKTYHQVGKLTPTHVSTTDQSEPFGCGLATDGSDRLFTTEVGSQAVGASSGQLDHLVS